MPQDSEIRRPSGAAHPLMLFRQERRPGAECAERTRNNRRRRTPAMLRPLRAHGWRSQASPGAKLILTLMRPRPDRDSSPNWLRFVPSRENPSRENRVRFHPAAPPPPDPPPAEASLFRPPVVLRSSTQANTAKPAAAATPAPAPSPNTYPPNPPGHRAPPRSRIGIRPRFVLPAPARSKNLPPQAVRRPDTPASTGSCQ